MTSLIFQKKEKKKGKKGKEKGKESSRERYIEGRGGGCHVTNQGPRPTFCRFLILAVKLY
jgi:hypothetical protein